MQYCESCHLHIDGDQDQCPLCQGKLKGEKTPSPFPHILTVYRKHGILLKTALFLSIVAAVACFLINWIFPQEVWWSVFVAAGLLSMWVALIAAIRKHSNLYKNVLWQVVIFAVLSVLWDLSTGWYRWSIDYVLPFLCILAMAVMAIAARIQNRRLQDYLNYLMIDMLFGIAPLVLLLTGQLHHVYPSVLCIAIGVLSFAAVLVFQWGKLWEEIRKRLHL